MKLQEYLSSKPLYYDEIDYTRMGRAYRAIKEHLPTPEIIHIIGTNGKGTTGRFLAHALYKAGYNTGHYTSPHIVDFNERIWYNAQEVDDVQLQEAHAKLLALLPQEFAETLSYFEYTTFLALMVYEDADFVVLEAGLGGEHDATSVFENILTLVTPIDYDHEAFLGKTIEEIAGTKLRAVQKKAILAEQKHAEVYAVAQGIAIQKGVEFYRLSELQSPKSSMIAQMVAHKEKLPNYLRQNLSLAIAALEMLGIGYDVGSFEGATLFGRMSRYQENVILDVGHNLLAAQALVDSLEKEEYILVYNSYADKNYEEILRTLRPIIKEVQIIEIEDERIVERDKLTSVLRKEGISFKRFDALQPEENYLVFGSFRVVEEFLKSLQDG